MLKNIIPIFQVSIYMNCMGNFLKTRLIYFYDNLGWDWWSNILLRLLTSKLAACKKNKKSSKVLMGGEDPNLFSELLKKKNCVCMYRSVDAKSNLYQFIQKMSLWTLNNCFTNGFTFKMYFKWNSFWNVFEYKCFYFDSLLKLVFPKRQLQKSKMIDKFNIFPNLFLI
jgi:hypothetical protein